MDPRVTELARIITDHSTEIKEGDKVLIQGSAEARPLLLEIYRRSVQRGAEALLNVQIGQDRIFFKDGHESLFDKMGTVHEFMYNAMDVMVNIYGPENTRSLAGVDPMRLRRSSKAAEAVSERLMRGDVRWVVAAYPTNALAQDAGMDLEDYEGFVYGATNVDYPEMKERGERVKAVFDEAVDVHLVAAGTDLKLRFDRRPGKVSWGKRNLPDGEVFYAPVEDGTEGVITYEYPALYGGQEVRGVRLAFEAGKVVEASADTNEAFLLATLDTDLGARILGEFGIGMNDGIQSYSRNVLFDEKMGGTVHLALGRSYPETGGVNRSAVHWDMVKDLRAGGELRVNGKLAVQGGRLVI